MHDVDATTPPTEAGPSVLREVHTFNAYVMHRKFALPPAGAPVQREVLSLRTRLVRWDNSSALGGQRPRSAASARTPSRSALGVGSYDQSNTAAPSTRSFHRSANALSASVGRYGVVCT